MRKVNVISLFLLIVGLDSCTTAYDCSDQAIQPVFIGFASADIDSFVLRKFQPNDSFRHVIDSFIIINGDHSIYQTSNDSTTVFVDDGTDEGKAGIKTGFDWELYIPSLNKTVMISDIVSEKATGKRSHGIFSLDHQPACMNRIFSAKIDSQPVSFSAIAGYQFFIRKD